MVTINSDTISPELLDLTFRKTGLGGIGSSTYTILNGLNNKTNVPPLPVNTDNQGLTFFTKPCLNLSYNNVIGIRRLAFLANNDPLSMANAIRCMLNPIGFDKISVQRIGRSVSQEIYGDNNRSKIMDDKNPFIPLLSNTLLSLSGWPDFAPETYTSPEGINKEQVSWIDARPDILNSFDLTANFANIEGDPITTLFSTWVEYATRVAEGSMIPFPINIVENRIDYQTRIYRLILDKTRTYVQRISACGAAFPIAVPLGANLNYTSEQPLTSENNQISIPFRALGALYDDPILIKEFNKTVWLVNKSMHDNNRETDLIKLNTNKNRIEDEKAIFNYKSYPRINPDTNELEWWVDKVFYNRMYKILAEAD